jgi:hypothetical protein
VPSSFVFTQILLEEKLPSKICKPVVTFPKLLLCTDYNLPPKSIFAQKEIVNISPFVAVIF